MGKKRKQIKGEGRKKIPCKWITEKKRRKKERKDDFILASYIPRRKVFKVFCCKKVHEITYRNILRMPMKK